MESVSITIPAYNEEENIANAIKEAYDFLKTLNREFEILVVNDGSTDKTGEIADSLKEKYHELRVHHHKKNKGFGGAISSCYRLAKKDLVYLAPADGQVKMAELQNFLDVIDDCDVVVGYRLNRPESIKRKIPSKIFHFLLRNTLGLKFKEVTTANLYRKKVLDSIKLSSGSAFLEAEIVYKAQKKGYRLKPLGITHHERVAGESKGDKISVIAKTAWDLLKFSIKLRLEK